MATYIPQHRNHKPYPHRDSNHDNKPTVNKQPKAKRLTKITRKNNGRRTPRPTPPRHHETAITLQKGHPKPETNKNLTAMVGLMVGLGHFGA